MSEAIEKLKAVGAQRIFETTHISRQNVEAIFDGSYRGMSKVQLFGFLTILEREYKLDLASVRSDYLAKHGQTGDQKEAISLTQDESTSEKNNKLLLLAAAVAVAAVIVFVLLGDRENGVDAASTQMPVQETIVPEANVTDVNESAAEVIEPLPAEPVLPERLVIEPKANLWMGLIDLATLKRSQKMTTRSVELDPQKSWLMVFGHGYFKVHVGENLEDFNERDKVRMIYEEGELRVINTEEFKAHNRGDNW